MDWISDTLARIRNAIMVNKKTVSIRGTVNVLRVIEVMKQEGFVESYDLAKTQEFKQHYVVKMAVNNGEFVLKGLNRISKPSLRRYYKSMDLKPFLKKFSVPVVSTSKGVLSGRQAIHENIGGELLCEVF
jgi:small subunit ribosomal protein S8